MSTRPLTRGVLVAAVAAAALPLARPLIRTASAYETWVDLNTYTKSREGGNDAADGAVARTRAFAGADGVWLITANSGGDNNDATAGTTGISGSSAAGFTLGDWRQIVANIAGPNARIATEDNPFPFARTDQSYRDALSIIGTNGATGFSLANSLQYNETGIDPAGGTVLSDAQIDSYAARFGGHVTVLTRSYQNGGTNGNWRFETDRALANAKVNAVAMETTDIPGQKVADFVRAADAAGKTAYLYLGTQNANRNIPGVYLLKQQARAALAGGNVRFVLNNDYDRTAGGDGSSDGYRFYGQSDSVEAAFKQVSALKLAVPVETWKWQQQAGNWSTRSNWTVGPVANPLTAAGGAVTSPSQVYDAPNFTSPTLAGNVTVNVDSPNARAVALYFGGAASYKLERAGQALTLGGYGTLGSDGRVPFAAGTIPTAVADDSNSYGVNVVPIQVRGTGTNVINADVRLDPNNTAGLLVDQGNTAHSFTFFGNLDAGGRFVGTTGPGDVNFNALAGNGTALRLAGTGTVRLRAASTYTGGTTVSFGNLLVDNPTGSGTGTGGVLIAGPSFLGGTGTVAGDVTVQNGGQLGPGDYADGHLTLGGSLDLAASSVFGPSASGDASHDLLSLDGVLSLAGDLDLRLGGGYVPEVGTTLNLIENAGAAAVVGGFANAPGGLYALDGRYYELNYAADLDGTANDVTLTRVAAPVPEPAGLALLGLGGLLLRRRR